MTLYAQSFVSFRIFPQLYPHLCTVSSMIPKASRILYSISTTVPQPKQQKFNQQSSCNSYDGPCLKFNEYLLHNLRLSYEPKVLVSRTLSSRVYSHSCVSERLRCSCCYVTSIRCQYHPIQGGHYTAYRRRLTDVTTCCFPATQTWPMVVRNVGEPCVC